MSKFELLMFGACVLTFLVLSIRYGLPDKMAGTVRTVARAGSDAVRYYREKL